MIFTCQCLYNFDNFILRYMKKISTRLATISIVSLTFNFHSPFSRLVCILYNITLFYLYYFSMSLLHFSFSIQCILNSMLKKKEKRKMFPLKDAHFIPFYSFSPTRYYDRIDASACTYICVYACILRNYE